MNNNALWARLKGFYIYGHAALNKKGSIVHFMCLCHKTQRYFTFPAGLQPMAFCPWRIWCVALKISSLCSLCAWFLPYTAYLLTAPLDAIDPAAWWIPCEVSSYRHSQRNYMFSAMELLYVEAWGSQMILIHSKKLINYNNEEILTIMQELPELNWHKCYTILTFISC